MRVARHIGSALLLLAGMVWGQEIQWDYGSVECVFEVGQPVGVLVTDAPTDASIDWDDGSAVEEIDSGDGSYTHSYSAPGEYTLRLLDDGGTEVADVFGRIYDHALAPFSGTVTMGEEVTVTIAAVPDDVQISDGGELRWGDGDVSDAKDNGDYSHSYDEAGSFTIELFAFDCFISDTQVEVLEPVITVDPATPRIDEAVTVIVDDEPVDGTLEWGNGESAPLDGSGEYDLPDGYPEDTTYTVEVLSELGATAAEQDVIVATPSLTVDPNNVTIGEEVTATVSDGPEGGELAWGDGDSETGLSAEEMLLHSYGAGGTYLVELRRSNGEPVGDQSVGVDSSTFDVTPGEANIGETITADVIGEPSGGSIDWGDGDVSFLDDSGFYEHEYDAGGDYDVALLDATQAVLTSRSVSITEPDLILNTAAARLSEQVEAVVTVVGNATVEWGDGETTGIDGDELVTHRYSAPGAYDIQVIRNGAPVAGANLDVLTPQLDLLTAAPAAVGETVTVAVTNAPFEAELEWGDGALETGVSDGGYDHAFSDGGDFDIELIDALQGSVVAEAELTVVQPDEAIVVDDIVYDGSQGEIEVLLTLSGLAVSQDYTLQSTDVFELVSDVGSVENVAVTFLSAGDHTLELSRQDTGELRATHEVELEWPRAGESIEILSDEPYLEGDFVEFELEGLNPDYSYTFDPDDESGYQRTIEGESSWSEIARYTTTGVHEPTLTVQYPGHFGASEMRDSLLVDIAQRTGAVTLRDDELPYGLETEFDLSDLVPGATYRLDFGDGEAEEFEAFGESEVVSHVYTSMPSSIDLESRIEGGGVWAWLDSAEPPMGMTFTGSVALEHGGTVIGDVQTFRGTNLLPGERYRFEVMSGTGPEEFTPVATSELVTADSEGVAIAPVTIPHEQREEQAEQPTRLYVIAYLHLGEEAEAHVDSIPFALPPLQRTLGTFILEITGLQRPFTLDHWNSSDFDGTGTVRDMVLAGKLQGDVDFTFDGFFQADLEQPLTLSLPARLNGLALTFSQLRLSARVLGYNSAFAGTGSLEGVEFEFSAGVTPDGVATADNLFSQTFDLTGELLISATYHGWMLVGDTGWRVGMSEGVGSGWFVIDLSEETRYNMHSANGDGLAIEDAYAGWQAAERTPDVDPASNAWTGVFFPPTYQTYLMRDPEQYSAPWSFAFPDSPTLTESIAWTGSGFQFLYHGNENHNQQYFWDIDVLSPYGAAVVDSQVVAETPARVAIELPLFEKPYVLGLKPDGSGGSGRGVTVVSQMPLARDFGSTALLADQPRFVVHDDRTADLVFDRAAWAIDQDFVGEGGSLDGTLATSMREDGEDFVYPPQAQSAYEDTLTALNTAESVFRLQLPIHGLTFSPTGSRGREASVSLNGETWQTLATTPQFDMRGFPYMTGANAEIGIKREGDEYALGLRGGLALGGLVRATAAPSWYHVHGGSEVRWVFEEVSVGLGDLYNVVPTPASFNLVIGGLISLDDEDASLEFSGGGQMTIGLGGGDSGGQASTAPSGLAIEVAGVFGINDSTADEKPYWFVYAGVDLAEMGTPYVVKVKGIDVMAFYLFRGGIGHNLRLDQRTGNEANDTCAVDDSAVGPSDDARPSVVKNALECFDDDNDLALLAGTVIGWHPQSKTSEIYGLIWHINANLTVNSSGQVILGGRGWAMRPLDKGYGQDVPPNMVARISGDENAVLGSFCLGNTGTRIGELDCSGLADVDYTVAGLKVLEAEATAELKASWDSGEYYFALGRQSMPVSIFVFPRETSGYFVAGYIDSPGIIDGSIPAAGIWASLHVGNNYQWNYSQSVLVCTLTAHANAYFSFGGAIGVQFAPAFQFDGQVDASAGANAGGSCGDVNVDVGVNLYASGRIIAPDPFEFNGSVRVTGDLPVVGDIDTTVDDVTISF